MPRSHSTGKQCNMTTPLCKVFLRSIDSTKIGFIDESVVLSLIQTIECLKLENEALVLSNHQLQQENDELLRDMGELSEEIEELHKKERDNLLNQQKYESQIAVLKKECDQLAHELEASHFERNEGQFDEKDMMVVVEQIKMQMRIQHQRSASERHLLENSIKRLSKERDELEENIKMVLDENNQIFKKLLESSQNLEGKVSIRDCDKDSGNEEERKISSVIPKIPQASRRRSLADFSSRTFFYSPGKNLSARKFRRKSTPMIPDESCKVITGYKMECECQRNFQELSIGSITCVELEHEAESSEALAQSILSIDDAESLVLGFDYKKRNSQTGATSSFVAASKLLTANFKGFLNKCA